MNENEISGVIHINGKNGDQPGQSERSRLVSDLSRKGFGYLCSDIFISSNKLVVRVRESREQIKEIIGVIEEISGDNYEVGASKILAKIISASEKEEEEGHQNPDGLKDSRKLVDRGGGWKVFE